MRLANKALAAALAMLVLCAAASAQTLRNENDPRNQSPSVGTGGPEGGATGLFTIYDGSTIRKGEFTFSIAYSNYDRDPGDVDISDIPLSFNVGLNDHIELWFKTNGYRGIKVNSPSNLSGFYLPNISLLCGSASPNGLCSGPAIIQAPSGPNVGTLAGNALFRPIGNQPFVNFPFSGGSAGNFQQGPGIIGTGFGFPGFNAQLGPPVRSSGSGTFGAADNFPGIGSVVGGILPGVVLATVRIPCTALTGGCNPPFNPAGNPITVPVTFTIAPSYLPDAPFLGREYGESSFTNFVAGAKIRFTGPNNPLGVAIIPFYRWWPDKADDAQGFRQLQRGAGPGGDIGDFGLVGVVDARLSRSVNVSANFGYILNSNPKGQFPSGEFVLLDRPDEFIAGVGFDFPVNKHIQPVLELRSTQYVGSRTPNAFENSPVEVLAGVKIFPRRWWGIGAAWRYHINQQDKSMFEGRDARVIINNLSGVDPIGPQPLTIVPATSFPATTGSFPIGFRPSDDANGFIGQFWIGHRNDRAPSILPNQAPTVTLSTSSASVTLPCEDGSMGESCRSNSNQSVQLSSSATDPDGDTLLYTYSVTGGRITGDGPNATWDLSGVTPGTYTATVEVDDGCGCVAFSSTTVTVARCTDCRKDCPTVTVSCPDSVGYNQPITFTASINGAGGSPTYNWSVSAGSISSGQGTSSITVDTTGVSGQSVTATVELGGWDPSCSKTASCTTQVGVQDSTCRKTDSYGDIRFDDEKARLDNFAIALQNDPGSTGYIIAYGTCEGDGPCTNASCIVAQKRVDRAKQYLVETRGIDAGRIVTIDGGCRAEVTVDLFVCQQGAPAPTPDMGAAVSPCPECRKAPVRRPRPRRRRGEE